MARKLKVKESDEPEKSAADRTQEGQMEEEGRGCVRSSNEGPSESGERRKASAKTCDCSSDRNKQDEREEEQEREREGGGESRCGEE